MSQHQGLPVAGYKPQDSTAVAKVNEHKQVEEQLLRRIEQLQALNSIDPGAHDPRWLAVARTHFEEGFMALNRAVFKPGRVKLPDDA